MQIFQKDYLDLVQDPFGNYAIQFAIDIFGKIECKNIIDAICEEIISLSLQKFSSNVVEKCIENCDNVIFLIYFYISLFKFLGNFK
jgi:hypothetical protein